MAVSPIGSWDAQEGSNDASKHTFATIPSVPAGSNRAMVLFVGGEQGNDDGTSIPTNAWFGDNLQALSAVAAAEFVIGTATTAQAKAFILLESGIAAADTRLVTALWHLGVTSPGLPDVVQVNQHHVAFYAGVDQAVPIVDSDVTEAASTDALSLTLDTTANGYLVAFGCNGNGGSGNTYSWTNATKRTDLEASNVSSSGSAAEASTNGSPVTVTSTFSVVANRQGLIALTLRPATASSFANPFGLLGVGRAA